LWRTAPSDAAIGRAIPELIAHDPLFTGVMRVGLVYQDDPYGQGQASAIMNTLRRLAPTIELFAIQYPLRGDVTSAVRQLATARPDLTVLVGFPSDARRILNLAATEPSLQRKHGNRWFFGDANKESSLFAALEHPEEIDGSYGIASADDGSAEAASFQARFHARFLHDAREQIYAASRYDAMYLLALGAAWAAGKDGRGAITGARIAEGLAHLSSGAKLRLTPEHFTAAKALLQSGQSIDVEGASGELDFDAATGEAPAALQLWRIQGQRFVPDRRLTLTTPNLP
jgi:branched-chain amino acid transport system substrate-binding protein